MLELPEVSARAAQIREHITGKTVSCVRPPSKEHKFCWYNGEPAAYHNALAGKKVTGAEGFGIFVEISFEDDIRLCVNDGVNMLLIPVSKAPRNYQLLMEFSDGLALVFTVAMYGGIYLHKGDYDNEYYIKSRQAISPFAPEFQEYFSRRRTESKKRSAQKPFWQRSSVFPESETAFCRISYLRRGFIQKGRWKRCRKKNGRYFQVPLSPCCGK